MKPWCNRRRWNSKAAATCKSSIVWIATCAVSSRSKYWRCSRISASHIWVLYYVHTPDSREVGLGRNADLLLSRRKSITNEYKRILGFRSSTVQGVRSTRDDQMLRSASTPIRIARECTDLMSLRIRGGFVAVPAPGPVHCEDPGELLRGLVRSTATGPLSTMRKLVEWSQNGLTTFCMELF